MGILLSEEERGVLTFKFLPSLSYPSRMAWAFLLIVCGLLSQILFLPYYWLGCIPMLLGNLLLLVNGCDDRVQFGKYNPKTGWERISRDDLLELRTKLRKLREQIWRWDISPLDVTNPIGLLVFVGLAGLLWWLIRTGRNRGDVVYFVTAADVAVLFIPHWITGLRLIPVKPSKVMEDKIDFLMKVVDLTKDALKNHTVQYHVLRKKARDDILSLTYSEEQSDVAIPTDVKIKVDIAGASPDFLGLYGQISMNKVQSRLYPYFYTVLVAKRGYGLKTDKDLVREYNRKRDLETRGYQDPETYRLRTERRKKKNVEVLVLRQAAGDHGYHTEEDIAARILRVGIAMAEQNAVRD